MGPTAPGEPTATLVTGSGAAASWRLLRALAADVLAFGGTRVPASAAAVLLAGLFESISLLLIAPLLALVGNAPVGARWQPLLHLVGGDREAQAAALLALFALAMVLRNGLVAWRQLAMATLEARYLADKQLGVLERLGRAPWPAVARLRHARITQLLGTEIYRIGQAAAGLLQIAAALITLAIQLAVALWLEPRLSAVALALVGVGAVLTLPLLSLARRTGETVTAATLNLLNDAGQFLGALKLAASQNLQNRFVADFETALDELVEVEIAYTRQQNLIRLRVSLLGLLVALGTAIAGIKVFGVPVGTLIALLAILSRMAAPVNQIQTQLGELFRSLPAFAQFDALAADLPAPDPAAIAPAPLDGDIRFERVTYLHDAAVGVRALDLLIPQGRFIGVAGRSGAGKTTFADLLVGLYAPQDGVISVGGMPAPLDRLPAWRDRLAYVSQDPFLHNDTIRANLFWGAPQADAALLEQVLALSGADTVIAGLADGLDTNVGERGGLVSGGERQRIALARALLRRPHLLILDEATNAIDVDTERAILSRLSALDNRTTVVMIAHRLESLAFCDQVAFFEGGRVVELGSFEQIRPRLLAVEREAGE